MEFEHSDNIFELYYAHGPLEVTFYFPYDPVVRICLLLHHKRFIHNSNVFLKHFHRVFNSNTRVGGTEREHDFIV